MTEVFNFRAVTLTMAIVAVGTVFARSRVLVPFSRACFIEPTLAAIAIVVAWIITKSLNFVRVKVTSTKAQLVGAHITFERVPETLSHA